MVCFIASWHLFFMLDIHDQKLSGLAHADRKMTLYLSNVPVSALVSGLMCQNLDHVFKDTFISVVVMVSITVQNRTLVIKLLMKLQKCLGTKINTDIAYRCEIRSAV